MSYDTSLTPYDNLVQALKERGYTLFEDGDIMQFSKDLVIGAFAPSHAKESIFQNKVLADHADAFNKWSQAPVGAFLPDTQDKLDRLFMLLEWVGSDEGFVASNEFLVEKWVRE